MKAITVIIGALFIGTGIYCFVNMKAAFLSLALILGLALMAYGVGQIFTYITDRENKGLTAWALAEGILTALIGVLVVFYPFQTDFVLAVWFAAWLLSSGVLRIVGALKTRKLLPGTPWGFMFFMGIVGILVGIYCLVHPMVTGMALALMLGIFFVLQGINCIFFGVSLPGMKSKK